MDNQMSLSDVDSDVEEDRGHTNNHKLKRSSSDTSLMNIVNDIILSNSCVLLLRHPSVINFCRLRKKLKSNDRRWMEDFLRRDGLELLFECLDNLGKYPGTFSNLVLRIECAMCIRTVMNSAIGLQCLISTRVAIKFAGGNKLHVVVVTSILIG